MDHVNIYIYMCVCVKFLWKCLEVEVKKHLEIRTRSKCACKNDQYNMIYNQFIKKHLPAIKNKKPFWKQTPGGFLYKSKEELQELLSMRQTCHAFIM